MNRRNGVLIASIAAVLVLAVSCGPGPNALLAAGDAAGGAAGFWQGLWHGIITPITFIWSLFSRDVNIYEVHNIGGWYNFGYVLGLTISFGGSGRGSGGRRIKRN
ncbi:MAG TPA: hypothetical protein VLH39_04375 [Magnetospirillaceae bacterium]|nr:hypothetical protein [Magnetospirillaceae bacterium]